MSYGLGYQIGPRRSLSMAGGTNLVQNGGFDTDTAWTKGENATISDGAAHLVVGGGTVEQSIPTVTGATYRVQADIVDGFDGCFCGAWDAAGQNSALSGSPNARAHPIEFTFEANDEDSFIAFGPVGGGNTSIDNVRVTRIA